MEFLNHDIKSQKFIEACVANHNNKTQFHAGMRANVDKIITVFPDEGIFASDIYFFILFLSKMILFLDGFDTFFLKSRVTALLKE